MIILFSSLTRLCLDAVHETQIEYPTLTSPTRNGKQSSAFIANFIRTPDDRSTQFPNGAFNGQRGFFLENHIDQMKMANGQSNRQTTTESTSNMSLNGFALTDAVSSSGGGGSGGRRYQQ